jgi:hypothetical protein
MEESHRGVMKGLFLNSGVGIGEKHESLVEDLQCPEEYTSRIQFWSFTSGSTFSLLFITKRT